MKSLIYPKAKPASHCLTELFSIYQNNNCTIRRWNDHTIVPSSHRIILKIVRIYATNSSGSDIFCRKISSCVSDS